MTGPSPSTDPRQDDAERWVQWQCPTWHLVHEIECDGDLVICRCGTYCYRHEQRLVAFTDVDPAQGRCSACEARSWTGPSLDLDALREKAEKATPGPWMVGQHTSACTVTAGIRKRLIGHFSHYRQSQARRDAAYVAAASPDVILAVLALVEEQRKENERLREALEFYADPNNIWEGDGAVARRALGIANEEPS